jgi:hypothetical protein
MFATAYLDNRELFMNDKIEHEPRIPRLTKAIHDCAFHPRESVPVSVAQQIAQDFSKSIVVITAMDDRYVTTATFGRTPGDKIIAAKIGEHFGIITGKGPGVFTEDFRKDFDAAKYKAALDALRSIVEMLDPDNPDSYRCNDSEGAMDTTHGTAVRALAAINSPVSIPDSPELEYLKWFRIKADFGPADGDVVHDMNERFEKETGHEVPKGWRDDE